ncbi:MAG: HupE/UreJ family protein [Bacteroidia bacterium]|nr:HupE/UreJ family protein [Bacteroidia bacterium]
MSPFVSYLTLGFQHISDLEGYDHILFLVALCAVYRLRQWRDILILVTAFTLGHSLSLGIATFTRLNMGMEIHLGAMIFPLSGLIEFLIPVTIFLTAISNITRNHNELTPAKVRTQYLAASLFGLIHGLGFSNFLQTILGREENLFTPLLAFNMGLELGQILIVAVLMAISSFFLGFRKVAQRDWILFVSGAAAGVAVILMMNKSL